MLKEETPNFFDILKCSLLIAGTCIGGGMLALPLLVGSFGFIPSVVVIFLSCIFMSISALLYMEATIWMNDGAHMNTLSANLLSNWWRMFCVIIYLFICYSSIVAYLSGGGKEISYAFQNLSENNSIYIFTTIFGLILLLGYQTLGRVNTILFSAMIFAYFMLIASGTSGIDFEKLERMDWSYRLLFTTPLMLTIFSFPGIVPSITYQLKKNVRSIKISIFLGTFLAFLVYIVWIFFVIGSVPYDGELGLHQAYICDTPIAQCIINVSKNHLVSVAAQFFAFFAIATSFLGISLSLRDFFYDTFALKKRSFFTSLSSVFLVIFPSLIFSIFFENVFSTALEISGGIGDAFLSGIIPALMVWNGRYKYNYTGSYTLSGGKPLLVIISLISLCIFLIEIFLITSRTLLTTTQ